jgi:hypothetical protein
VATLTRSTGKIAGSAATWVRQTFALRSADSPTRLRAAMAITVIAGLALSIGGWYSIDRRDTAIDAAARAAEQLIQVQDVRVQVVQADSIASNAYLVGGQEASDQRAEYDSRIAAAAAGLLVAVQTATTLDAQELESANQRLAVYAGLVEQARANNRQGFPVGAAYQRQAREVASLLVDSLRSVEQSTRRSVDDSMERAYRASWLLVVTALVVLAAVVSGSWWLAVRWRRLVNVPIALAAVVAVAVLTVGVGVNGRAVARAGDAVRGPLSAADLVAQARAAGFDARSSEALTLINRGNGAAYETEWLVSASVVASALGESCLGYRVGCEAAEAYERYAGGHEQVRTLDDGGGWERAVELGTIGSLDGVEQPPGTNPPADFEQFAVASGEELVQQSRSASTMFDEADGSLVVLRWLVVLAGLVIAVLASSGYGRRLREYR